MTNFRAITKDTTYLNDGGPAADFGKKETTVHWSGDQKPGQEVIGSIASEIAGIPEVGYRQVLPGVESPNEEMRRDYPLSQFASVIRGRSVLVQRQRTPKFLGWKTIEAVAIEDLISETEKA
ncbi:MAG: hypothetical protein QG623_57 [Patescibacteria group bacterium]|nr:hypothetical protein [Patescibacteria group bacterium]